MSASPKSTPRLMKKPFGPVFGLSALDEEVFEITNFENEKIALKFSKLSPLLEQEESMIKKTLMAVFEKGLFALVSTLNTLIRKFHSASIGNGCTSSPPSTPIKKDPAASPVSQQSQPGSTCLGLTHSSSKNLSVSLLATQGESASEESEPEEQGSPKKKVKKITYEDNADVIDVAQVAGEDDIDNGEGDQFDIMDSVNEVIKNARYKSINPDWCEIPAGISVNKDLVSQLKDALVTHPDKTQVFLGVVCVTDDEDNMIGGFQVYVNPELFLALRELSLEGFSIQKNTFLPAIVHELGEHDSLDAVTLGMFLNKNSKDFSQKIRDNMKYQDLVRFCVSTISNQTKGSEVAVKDYLKLALKEFSKGRSNWSLFISLASLPASYLTQV